jgi:hypothetical protein
MFSGAGRSGISIRSGAVVDRASDGVAVADGVRIDLGGTMDRGVGAEGVGVTGTSGTGSSGDH